MALLAWWIPPLHLHLGRISGPFDLLILSSFVALRVIPPSPVAFLYAVSALLWNWQRLLEANSFLKFRQPSLCMYPTYVICSLFYLVTRLHSLFPLVSHTILRSGAATFAHTEPQRNDGCLHVSSAKMHDTSGSNPFARYSKDSSIWVSSHNIRRLRQVRSFF